MKYLSQNEQTFPEESKDLQSQTPLNKKIAKYRKIFMTRALLKEKSSPTKTDEIDEPVSSPVRSPPDKGGPETIDYFDFVGLE